MTQYVTQSVIGQKVTFTSKNPVDATTYVGTVTAMLTYQLAPQFGDPTSYNAEVQRADPTVGATNTLTYFLITLDNGQDTQTTRLFADAWVSPGSFSVVQSAAIYTINVYDLIGSGIAGVITALQASGYNAVQVTDPAALALTQQQGTTTVAQTDT
jgi:hypothetical protein